MICPNCENIQEVSGPCVGRAVRDGNIVDCNFIFPVAICCDKPLGPSEISAQVDYHFDCLFCIYCKEAINEQVVLGCRRESRPFSHRHCWLAFQENEMKKAPVTVTQGTIDYLNAFRLLLEPKDELEVETQQKDADISFQSQRWIHQKDYDWIFKFGKRAEAVAACCMLILADAKKDRRLELQKKDVEKIQAHRERSESDQRKKEVKELNKLPDINALKKLGIDPIEAQKMIMREKSIRAQMAIGLTREQAEASLKAQESIQ